MELVRMQYYIYSSKEDALAEGFPDAEYGMWQASPASTDLIEGWIALDYV